MDKYSRLLVHFSTVKGSGGDPQPYHHFVKELAVLENPSDELCRIIKDDMHTILPALIILSVHDDASIRAAVTRTYGTFLKIIKSNPSVVEGSWWKDMEDKVVTQIFSVKLMKLVEVRDPLWPESWVFVLTLLIELPSTPALNPLLKVIEMAFKWSRKDAEGLKTAYYCWRLLIDGFANKSPLYISQKLIELMMRPLGASISDKCPDATFETWCHLLKKIAYVIPSKANIIVEPFLCVMFLSGKSSYCMKEPKECLKMLDELVQQKKIFHSFSAKVFESLEPAFQISKSKELQDLFLIAWGNMIVTVLEYNVETKLSSLSHMFSFLIQIRDEKSKVELQKELVRVCASKDLFTLANLKLFLDSHSTPLYKQLGELVLEDVYRETILAASISSILDSLSEFNNRQQNSNDLRVWDFVCEAYVSWVAKHPIQQEVVVPDLQNLISLLFIPFLFKQCCWWQITVVQKRWFGVVDTLLGTASSGEFLTAFLAKMAALLPTSPLALQASIDISSHLTEADKSLFKDVMPLLSSATKFFSPKDGKLVIDVLQILENSINRVPKTELNSLLNELMRDSNAFEHPWSIRIKTKCTRVLKRVLVSKDPEEEEKGESSRSPTPQRTPNLTQSSFFQRLAKAEEKRKKKVPTHASVFGSSGTSPSPGSSTPSTEEEISTKDQSGPLPALQPSSLVPSDSGSSKEDKALADTEPVVKEEKLKEPMATLSPFRPVRVTRAALTPTKEVSTLAKAVTPVSRKAATPKSASKTVPPPVYFEESAQEDFVVVPPKRITTVLTEHQKEMLSRRKSDIPALYQDLSQDTQSESQSMIDIDLQKFSNTGSTLNKTGSSEKTNQPSKEHVSPGLSNNTSENHSSSTSVDMFKETESAPLIQIKAESANLGTQNQISERVEPSPIPDTQEKPLNNSHNVLADTPTKLPRTPTQKNLRSLMDLEEEKEEELKEDKENISSKQTDNLLSKRRSSERASLKVTDEKSDNKIKQKKEQKEVPEITVESSASDNKTENKITNSLNAVDVLSSTHTPDKGSENTGLNDDKGVEKNISVVWNGNCITKNLSPTKDSITPKEVSLLKETATVSSAVSETPDAVTESPESVDPEEQDSDLNLDIKSGPSTTKILNKELSENLSADVSNWDMATPGKSRTRKKKSLEKSTNFSPKLLRSKRLSLTKKLEESQPQKKKARKSMPAMKTRVESDNEKPSKTESSKKEKPAKETPKKAENVNTPNKKEVTQSGKNDEPKSAKKQAKNTMTPTPSDTPKVAISLNTNRKRRSVSNEDQPTQKKSRNSNIENSVDENTPLLLVPTPTGKPRKGKIVKANVKNSQNNLEQWLIKTGKTIVVAPVISEGSQNPSENETPKIIGANQAIEVNVGKPNEIIIKVEPSKLDNLKIDSKLLSSANESNTESISSMEVTFAASDSEDLMNKTSIKLDVSGSEETFNTLNKDPGNPKNLTKSQSPKTSLRVSPRKAAMAQGVSVMDLIVHPTNESEREEKRVESLSPVKSALSFKAEETMEVDKTVTSSSCETQPQSSLSSCSVINVVSETPAVVITESSPLANQSSRKNPRRKASPKSSPVKNCSPKKSSQKRSFDTSLVLISDSPEKECVIINLDSPVKSPQKNEINESPTSEVIEESPESCKKSPRKSAIRSLMDAVPLMTIEENTVEEATGGGEEEESNEKSQQKVSPKCDSPGREVRALQQGSEEEQREAEPRLRRRSGGVRQTPSRELPSSSSSPERRSARSRSAQMVRMAVSSDASEVEESPEPPLRTPIRKRSSIQPFNKTENWPGGRTEPWVPHVYTPPIGRHLYSPGILKQRQFSPTTSPTASPVTRKKRVSFLDPVVYSGLMYAKDVAVGEIQYANLPSGDKWSPSKGKRSPEEEKEVEERLGRACEGLAAVQEAISAADSSHDIDVPLELDLSRLPTLSSCLDPIECLLSDILPHPSTYKKALSELEQLNISTVADLCSLDLVDLERFSDRFLKCSPLVGLLEEYLSKTEDSKETKENTDELEETQVTSMLSPMPPSGLVSLDGEQDLTPVKETGRRRKGQQMALVAVARERVWVGRDAAGRKHSIKETVDTIEETLVVPMMRRGTQTAVQIDPQCSISYPLMLEDGKSLDLKPEAIYQQLKDSPVTADKLLDLLASDDQLTKVFIEKISNRLTPSTTVSLAIDMLHQAKEKM